MIFELQQYFGSHELIVLVKNILLRNPVIFYHEIERKKIFDLVSLGAPHRFFAALTKTEAEDIEKILKSEQTEGSKRIVLFLKNPLELPKSKKGWIAQIEYEPPEEMRKKICVYDTKTQRFLNPSVCNKDNILLSSVERYIMRLTSFEELYGANETKIFASNFIDFMISQIKIIANFALTKQRELPRDAFISEMKKTISSVFTFKGFFTLALEIFSREYHTRLKETLEELKIDPLSFDETKNPEFETHFVELKKMLGVERLVELVEYALMGFPIVIRANKKVEDKLVSSLAYILRHRKILFDIPEDKSIWHASHVLILRNVKKLPNKAFDMIVTTTDDKIIGEIRNKEFYAVFDLNSGVFEFSHEFQDFLKEAFELNQEIILINYLDSQINRINILTDLLEVTAQNSSYTKSLLLVSSKEEKISDWLVLIALLRAKRPSNKFLTEFLKLVSSIRLVIRSYHTIKVKKNISVDMLENLISNVEHPEVIFQIIGGQGTSIYDLLTRRLRRSFAIWQTLERLIREGVIEIE